MFKKVSIIAVVALLSVAFSDYAWSADRGTINSGETKFGISLTGPSYMDTWTFQGNAGDRVIINAVTTTGDIDTTIYIYPPGGGPAEASTYHSYLGSIWGDDRLDYQLQQTGIYTIVIQDSTLNKTGIYNLSLLKIPGPVNSSEDPDGGTIVSGETLSGTINTASDMDAFQFWSSAGARVLISSVTTNGNLDTTIYLYPPGGGPAEASTYHSYLGSIWGDDRLDYQLQQTGIYTIVIQDSTLNKTGIYNLSLLKIPGPVNSSEDPDGGMIVSGETLSGTINTASDMDAFQFYGNAGDRAIINAVSSTGNLDTTIYLYPPGGGTAEANTYHSYLGSIWGDDHLDHQLQQTGLYTIVIQDVTLTNLGTYDVSFSKIPADPRPGIYNPYPSNGATVTNSDGSFSWDPVAGATGYDLYFGTYVIEPIYKIGDNLQSTSFAFPVMESGKTYYWTVVAHTPSGDIVSPAWWFTFAPSITPSPIISGFSPTSGPVGTAVSIAGNNFATTPVVEFNGVNAVVTNATDSLINAIVPAGATTGAISVMAVGGTAYSSANFTVTETQQQYTLTVTKTGTGDGIITSSTKGINCGSGCDEAFPSNAKPKKVTLKLKPDAYSTFLGWGGDCQAYGTKTSCKLTMDSDKNVTASFGLPDILVAPDSYDFGDVTVKQSSSPATFTIQNNGTGDLKKTKMKIGGTDAKMFKLKGSCSKAIASGGSCQFTVAFNPKSTGSKTATVQITSNDPDTATLEIPLTGSGI